MKTVIGVKAKKETAAAAAKTAKQCTSEPFTKAPRKNTRESENIGRRTAIASEQALGKIWDSTEEDEAWRHL